MKFPKIISWSSAVIVMLVTGIAISVVTGSAWFGSTAIASDTSAGPENSPGIHATGGGQSGPVYAATSSAGERIGWHVISSGGINDGGSAELHLGGTAVQTAVGTSASDNYMLFHGFWQTAGGVAPCDCNPGDPNADAATNVGDAVYLINFIFKSGPAPTPYTICSGDANGDCAVNVGDAVYQINYIFKSGPAPVTCDEWRATCGALGKN